MNFVRRAYLAAAIGVVGALLLAIPAPLQAQTTSASLWGSVKDSQGGALPGATVALTSRTQGNTLTTTRRTGRAASSSGSSGPTATP